MEITAARGASNITCQPKKCLIATRDETSLLTVLVTASMSQLTAVCLQAHQWAQIGTTQSNSHSRGLSWLMSLEKPLLWGCGVFLSPIEMFIGNLCDGTKLHYSCADVLKQAVNPKLSHVSLYAVLTL